MRRHPLAAILLVLFLLGQKIALSADDQGDASMPGTESPSAPVAAPAESPASATPAATSFPTPAPVETAAPTPAPEPTSPAPTAVPVDAAPTPAPAAPVPTPTPTPAPQQHVALLLPLDSKTYSHAAESTRDGFTAAAEATKSDGALPIKTYPTDDTAPSLLDAYARAVRDGAAIVVGPITREGVTALARSGAVSVPTLALNAPDTNVRPPSRLLVLSVSLEAEARQLAQLAHGEKRRKVAVVTGTDALSKRMRNAFGEEWKRLGGGEIADYTSTKDSKVLAALRSDLRAKGIDAVVLALDTPAARSVRPYLGNATVYASSRVFRGTAELSTNLDLKGVHFIEMPWLLLQQAPEVQAWPRSKKPLSIELERFYALGVDAWRLSQLMLKDSLHGTNFAGMTGALTLDSGNFFARLLPQASFDDSGQVVVGGPMP